MVESGEPFFPGFAEETDNDFFSMQTWAGGYPEVLFEGCHLHRKATVLRHYGICDIHFRKEFDPNDHCVAYFSGKAYDVSQVPVHAEAEHSVALVRFEMNIARVLLEGSDEHAVRDIHEFARFYHLDQLLAVHRGEFSPFT